MASSLLKLLSTLFALCLVVEPSLGSPRIGVFWGQHKDEGSLDQACGSGFYDYVNIVGLDTFGNFTIPNFNIAGHTDKLNQEIKFCQQIGVKVMLSIGGGGVYTLVSKEDARNLSSYLWDNFLGGSSESRPFGDAVFNGINFDIHGGSNNHYDDLVRYLSSYSTPEQKVYLSASPQCTIPDYYLGEALDTGLFNFVTVQFYNDPECQYVSGNSTKLLNSWNDWTTSINSKFFYFGLPASPEVALSGGYIPAETFLSEIVPVVWTSSKFGGVMLWTSYEDSKTGYSRKLRLLLGTGKDVM